MADRFPSGIFCRTIGVCRCPIKSVSYYPMHFVEWSSLSQKLQDLWWEGLSVQYLREGWQAIFATPTKPSSSEGTPQQRGWKTRKSQDAGYQDVIRHIFLCISLFLRCEKYTLPVD